MRNLITLFVAGAMITPFVTLSQQSPNQKPVSAPMTTDIAGQSGSTAAISVYRIQCPKKNSAGTGFLHRSGRVVTASHVVEGCSAADIQIMTISGETIAVTNVVTDTNVDLALLTPAHPIGASSFSISTNSALNIGQQLSTWGYPAGYTGPLPLLSVGCLSGLEQRRTPSGQILTRFVVNAAFNSGNSGGPLLDVESRAVVGVVVSKLAPLPKQVESEIAALKNSPYGVQYSATDSSGNRKNFSEAQVLADVIEYLRSQVQLVIGYAATSSDLQNFIRSQGLEP